MYHKRYKQRLNIFSVHRGNFISKVPFFYYIVLLIFMSTLNTFVHTSPYLPRNLIEKLDHLEYDQNPQKSFRLGCAVEISTPTIRV